MSREECRSPAWDAATAGEISLLTGIACTATLTALTDVRFQAIESQMFIDIVTSHPASASHAERLVRERLRSCA